MKRYRIFYDQFHLIFCQMDTASGAVFDRDGKITDRFADSVYEQWEQRGGTIEERDDLIVYEPPKSTDDDDSTPPDWLDEFEYIDWCITHGK